MGARVKHPSRGSSRAREVRISGTITIGSSGAISAQAADGVATAVKTASKTGRYTVTLDRTYKNLRVAGAPGVVGPTDAAFGDTAAKAGAYRNVTGSSFDIQMFISNGTDTEAASGYVIHWAVFGQE